MSESFSFCGEVKRCLLFLLYVPSPVSTVQDLGAVSSVIVAEDCLSGIQTVSPWCNGFSSLVPCHSSKLHFCLALSLASFSATKDGSTVTGFLSSGSNGMVVCSFQFISNSAGLHPISVGVASSVC